MSPIPEEGAIWHKFEKQGGRVLHTLKTRDLAVARAMMVAPELLEALEDCYNTLVLCTLIDRSGQVAKSADRANKIIIKAKEAI